MKKIPEGIFFNHVSLKAKKYKREIQNVISDVIDSGVYLNGTEEEKLRTNLELYLGKGYVVTTSSGHDALSLALSSLSLANNDEIIFPVNAYPTAFPICLSGATPVPVDVDENGQIDVRTLVKKITKKTKVIVVVYLYGLVGNLSEIISVVRKTEIILIEDCAQAFGSMFRKKPVGTFGDIGCFSFYPTKNLGTLGDGGALWTRHKKYYDYFERAKSYGESKRYKSYFVSGHSRLPEIQAGVLNVYLKYIKEDLKNRAKIAYLYLNRIQKRRLSQHVRVLASDSHSHPAHHLFVVEAKGRDGLRAYLKKNTIETHIHYPNPIHLLPAFSALGYKRGDFPTAERLAKSVLSLPFHPFLSLSSVDFVTQKIQEYYHD